MNRLWAECRQTVLKLWRRFPGGEQSSGSVSENPVEEILKLLERMCNLTPMEEEGNFRYLAEEERELGDLLMDASAFLIHLGIGKADCELIERLRCILIDFEKNYSRRSCSQSISLLLRVLALCCGVAKGAAGFKRGVSEPYSREFCCLVERAGELLTDVGSWQSLQAIWGAERNPYFLLIIMRGLLSLMEGISLFGTEERLFFLQSYFSRFHEKVGERHRYSSVGEALNSAKEITGIGLWFCAYSNYHGAEFFFNEGVKISRFLLNFLKRFPLDTHSCSSISLGDLNEILCISEHNLYQARKKLTRKKGEQGAKGNSFYSWDN